MSRPYRIPGTLRRQPSVLLVLPTIPDAANTDTKNAIAARNRCATEGRCPICGATPERLHQDDELEDVWHLLFEHEPGCPVPEVYAA